MQSKKIEDKTPIKEAFNLIVEDISYLTQNARETSSRLEELGKNSCSKFELEELKQNVDKILLILSKKSLI